MTERRSSLTGCWSGAFVYAIGGHETVFNAQIEDSGGAFTGVTQEPNDFIDSDDDILHAEIEGHREGSAVTFVKRYKHQHREARHTIRYEGTADADLTRIEGQWSVSSNWTGTFAMIREDNGEAAAIEEAAETEAV